MDVDAIQAKVLQWNWERWVTQEELLELCAEVRRLRDCPIGLDKTPQFCSAGTCPGCLAHRLDWMTQEVELVEAELVAANARAEAAEELVRQADMLAYGVERAEEGDGCAPCKLCRDRAHILEQMVEQWRFATKARRAS